MGSELCPENFRVKRLSEPRDNVGRHNRTAHTVSMGIPIGHQLARLLDSNGSRANQHVAGISNTIENPALRARLGLLL